MSDNSTPERAERAIRERLAYHERLAEQWRALLRLLWPNRVRNEPPDKQQ
jgi:hypothetical protein